MSKTKDNLEYLKQKENEALDFKYREERFINNRNKIKNETRRTNK